jgi:cell division protease FtsH
MSTWHGLTTGRNVTPPDKTPVRVPPPPPPKWRNWLLPVGILATVLLLLHPSTGGSSPTKLSYTDFVTDVTANKVTTATIDPTGAVTGKLAAGGTYSTRVPVAIKDDSLSPLLLAHKVQVTGSNPSTTTFASVLISLLPLILLVGAFVYIGRRSRKQLGGAGGLGGLMGVGKSNAKVYDQEKPTTRFTDIAGYEGSKQEVTEVVDFLKNPDKYKKAGAVGPKGVLMVGPPGTGKTLLARAVAGEAGVVFFALTGSSFVEMFVGVGASRVRSLFADARKQAPSIIFIDEIDAIGGKRGGNGFGSNDEREQTLNQLLSEMDGFEPGSNVVVMAATNRVETLDAALLRPGRFDRTVEIPLPNQAERTAILAIHCKGKTIDPDVDLGAVSRGTPGFSGADLANLVNEAAINAVRSDRSIVTADDFTLARDRLLLGRRDASNALLPDEKHSVAVHEAGHALVAALSDHTDPVAKVTILPRGQALGVTEQLPEAERHLYPESYLIDSLAVRLGGRAGELVMLGEASTGASNDLESATGLATRMVREFGLSPELGPIGYGGDQGGSPFAGRPYSEETQRAIDKEVAALLRTAETRAISLLNDNREIFDRVVALLLEKETIDGSELMAIVGRPPKNLTPAG